MSLQSGQVNLSDGHIFRWVLDDEVYGWIEDAGGSILKDTGGWYRTEDPFLAASYAAGRFGFNLLTSSDEQHGDSKLQAV